MGFTRCSIHNDDSAFTFALNSDALSLDNTGQLTLFLSASMLGSQTVLSRFSYQIVATVRPVSPKITGQISWNATLYAPPGNPPGVLATIGSQLSVIAYQSVPSNQPGVFPSLVPVGSGRITSVAHIPVGLEILNSVTYEIDNPPLGVLLVVQVQPGAAFHPPSGSALTTVQSQGPSSFTLTVANPSVECDFYISSAVIPVPQ